MDKITAAALPRGLRCARPSRFAAEEARKGSHEPGNTRATARVGKPGTRKPGRSVLCIQEAIAGMPVAPFGRATKIMHPLG